MIPALRILLLATTLSLLALLALWGEPKAEAQLLLPTPSPTPLPALSRDLLRSPPPHRQDGTAPRVLTGRASYSGVEATANCGSCHTTRPADSRHGQNNLLPDEFHQGLVFTHGAQSCLNCHHREDYDSLRLANGDRLPISQAQQLCTQCHGPQARDYANGAHGGMNGFWDTTKGPRTRRTCTDCHDVHAPAYPQWTPVFPPRDAAALQQAKRENRSPANTHE